MNADVSTPTCEDGLSEAVLGCCKEVYRRLGPGFSKSTYEEALGYELTLKRLPYLRRVPVPLFYRGVRLSTSAVLDFAVDGRLVVDVRALDAILRAQRLELRFRLRVTGLDTGLLANFGAPRFSESVVLIRRRHPTSSLDRRDSGPVPVRAAVDHELAVAS